MNRIYAKSVQGFFNLPINPHAPGGTTNDENRLVAIKVEFRQSTDKEFTTRLYQQEDHDPQR
jgi:hypothetical protein